MQIIRQFREPKKIKIRIIKYIYLVKVRGSRHVIRRGCPIAPSSRSGTKQPLEARAAGDEHVWRNTDCPASPRCDRRLKPGCVSVPLEAGARLHRNTLMKPQFPYFFRLSRCRMKKDGGRCCCQPVNITVKFNLQNPKHHYLRQYLIAKYANLSGETTIWVYKYFREIYMQLFLKPQIGFSSLG